MAIFDGLMNLLGIIIRFFYDLVHNYGVAIILFTIFIKVILLPLTIKQQASMRETQKIQPLIKELQDKYKTDKEKLNQEMMKLYKEHNVNPLGGCLPLLIQLPIILCLFWVVRRPITYVMGINPNEVEVFTAIGNYITAYASEISEGMKEIYSKIEAGTLRFSDNEIVFAQLIWQHPEILHDPIIAEGMGNLKAIDFRFLGLDLSQTPSFSRFDWLWIIPVLSGATTYLSTQVMQAQQNTNSPAAPNMQMMNTLFPFISAWITFTLPASMGIYWIVSNVVQIAQQYGVNEYFKRKENMAALDK